MNQSWVLLKQMNEYLASFLKYFLPTIGITIPLFIIISTVYLIIKYGMSDFIKLVIDKVDYIIDKTIKDIERLVTFIVSQFDKILESITKRAAEISMLINVVFIYQHPPEGDVQYATFCAYLAINTLVLIKKGNVDLEKFVSLKK